MLPRWFVVPCEVASKRYVVTSPYEFGAQPQPLKASLVNQISRIPIGVNIWQIK